MTMQAPQDSPHPAVVIPTYGPHLPLCVRFVRSLARYDRAARAVPIYFFTSTAEERASLERSLADFTPAVRERVHVVSLDAELGRLEAARAEIDADPDNGFATGSLGLITLKKLAGVAHAFARGHEWAVILDSEVVLFRPGDFGAGLARGATLTEYRLSRVATKTFSVAAVQHDSMRTIAPSYDTRDHFAQGFGWYDNLCAFRAPEFKEFLTHLAGPGAADPVLAATLKFRRYAFDWTVYRVWLKLIKNHPVHLIDVDQIMRDQGATPLKIPQLENLYQAFGDDVGRNAALVRALDPHWVPYSENARVLRALEDGLDPSCCLMFHTDRRHVGWHRDRNVVQRAIGWARRRIEAWLDRSPY